MGALIMYSSYNGFSHNIYRLVNDHYTEIIPCIFPPMSQITQLHHYHFRSVDMESRITIKETIDNEKTHIFLRGALVCRFLYTKITSRVCVQSRVELNIFRTRTWIFSFTSVKRIHFIFTRLWNLSEVMGNTNFCLKAEHTTYFQYSWVNWK